MNLDSSLVSHNLDTLGRISHTQPMSTRGRFLREKTHYDMYNSVILAVSFKMIADMQKTEMKEKPTCTSLLHRRCTLS
jgi:hypothetical protein